MLLMQKKIKQCYISFFQALVLLTIGLCALGAEEGRRYIERTVSKHSEMVGSIRELSDRLMALEAKLKVTRTHTHTHTPREHSCPSSSIHIVTTVLLPD